MGATQAPDACAKQITHASGLESRANKVGPVFVLGVVVVVVGASFFLDVFFSGFGPFLIKLGSY